ncbi:T6SS immunity protein Tdi1 domain-containing protein [Tundrisphaera sp. TA3]|uniref:T6SS immunity protein Tdi1 domain-containing protein n=1 Tax=Tundrisphaera sp. TA3 TaxID=3435775 RepID=UPI003EC09C06
MTVDDYLLDPDKPDWPKLLADWRPLLPYEFSIWLMNRFGDLFLVCVDHSVCWLDVSAGTLTLVADNWQDFSRKLDEGPNAEAWLRPDLVDQLVAAGHTLGPGQCYGLRIPTSGGGAYTVENCVVRPIAHHFVLLAPRASEGAALAVDDTPMTIKVNYHPDRPPTVAGPGKAAAPIKVDYGRRN